MSGPEFNPADDSHEHFWLAEIDALTKELHDLKQSACSRELLHAVEVRDLRRVLDEQIHACEAQAQHIRYLQTVSTQQVFRIREREEQILAFQK